MQKRISFVVDPEGSSIVGSEQKAVGPLQKLQGHLPPTMVTRRDKYLLKREVLVSDNSCQVSNENNSLCRTFFLSALIREVATIVYYSRISLVSGSRKLVAIDQGKK